jgi:hypothetical protein
MTSYPEQVPNGNFDHFLFSFSSAARAEQDVQKEFDAMAARINAIVDSEKFFVQNFPVLRNIVSLQPTKDELKKLSKAIDRLADLIEIFGQITAKLSMIKTMQEHPHWFTDTFADFAKEIDRDLDSLFTAES